VYGSLGCEHPHGRTIIPSSREDEHDDFTWLWGIRGKESLEMVQKVNSMKSESTDIRFWEDDDRAKICYRGSANKSWPVVQKDLDVCTVK